MQDTVEFRSDDRYFPTIHIQYRTPVFFWDDFITLRDDVWGDNQSGNITIVKKEQWREGHGSEEALPGGDLELRNKQMIWSLKRFLHGQVEFRWAGIGARKIGNSKFMGFGDPNEGYAAGFRLYGDGVEGAELYAVVINHGQAIAKKIPWMEDYASHARFIISWFSDKIEFITITPELYKKVAIFVEEDLPGIGLPKIHMEISIQSVSGTEPVYVPMVKYDSYSNH